MGLSSLNQRSRKDSKYLESAQVGKRANPARGDKRRPKEELKGKTGTLLVEKPQDDRKEETIK